MPAPAGIFSGHESGHISPIMTVRSQIALCAAQPVPCEDGVPEWVHLLPAGPAIETGDRRGPYFVKSMQAIADQLKDGDKLPIDECHASDRAAPQGQPAPARGWIVALEARADGLWGKVEWTGQGRQLMEDKAYRGISPAILHDHEKTVRSVLRASLINTPNLKGLVALHSEESGMDWKAKLIELLKLDSEADDAAIEAALKASMEAEPAVATQGQQLESEAVVALQAELTDTAGKLNALQAQVSRDQAVSFVDGAIAAGRVGLKPLRDEYIALHMEDAARAAKLIGGMPVLKGSTHAAEIVNDTDEGGLSAADRQVIALMGLSEDEYKESLKASGMQKEAL